MHQYTPKKKKHSRATCKYPVSCSNRIFTRRATHSCMCNSWLSSLITIMMFSGGDVAQDVAGEPARTQQQQQQGRNPTPTPVRLSSSWPPCSQRAAESRSQDVTADSQRKSQQWGEVGLRSRTHKYTLYIILSLLKGSSYFGGPKHKWVIIYSYLYNMRESLKALRMKLYSWFQWY